MDGKEIKILPNFLFEVLEQSQKLYVEKSYFLTPILFYMYAYRAKTRENKLCKYKDYLVF